MTELLLYASRPHYAEHLAPLAVALETLLYCDNDATFDAADDWLLEYGGLALRGRPRDWPGRPTIVSSWRDAQAVPPSAPLCLLEHGAGQTYLDSPDDPHYAGGDGWDRAALILAPGPHSARAWRHRYPDKPIVELGGSPRLDHWARRSIEAEQALCGLPQSTSATPIAVSFHWGATVSPEAGSAWAYWQPAVAELARHRPVLGHAHPRLWPSMRQWYKREGIEATPSFDELLSRCWVYLCDNSSTMYEWAGLGRPVLGIPHPAWRRDVEHGLRFWEHRPGADLQGGSSLRRGVGIALDDPSYFDDDGFGATACVEAYGMARFDGRATERAVAAIQEHLLA